MKLGYTLFYVDDVSKTMDFYEKAFGLKKGFSHQNQYGEMVTGETKLGFVNHETASSHGSEYEKSNLQKKPSAFEIGFVTKDVEAAFNTAVSAGATSVSKPKTKPWGQVVSYVRDCNGFLVEICSPIASSN
jgi:predicted enzyme related to lactoylglutathione lyase